MTTAPDPAHDDNSTGEGRPNRWPRGARGTRGGAAPAPTERPSIRPDHPATAGLPTEDADRAAQLTVLLSRPGDEAPR